MRWRDPEEGPKALRPVLDVPWRLLVSPDEDLAWVAHRVACHARWPSTDGSGGPASPVTYRPTGREGGWVFRARGRTVTPAEALDLLDAWMPKVGPDFRAWVWEMTLNGPR